MRLARVSTETSKNTGYNEALTCDACKKPIPMSPYEHKSTTRTVRLGNSYR